MRSVGWEGVALGKGDPNSRACNFLSSSSFYLHCSAGWWYLLFLSIVARCGALSGVNKWDRGRSGKGYPYGMERRHWLIVFELLCRRATGFLKRGQLCDSRMTSHEMDGIE